MLTPNQISNHSFTANRGSYKAAEVDEYMGEIIASYEQMFKENGELLDKLEMLAKKIEEYREDEDKIKHALIVAEKTAHQITQEAREKATGVLADAKEKADNLLGNSSSDAQSKLTSAEQTANDVIESAKVLADNVISQAKSSSEEILIGAKAETEMQQSILNNLRAEATMFKNDLLAMYQSHIEAINDIPALAMEDYKKIMQRFEDAPAAEDKAEEASAESAETQVQQAAAPVEQAEEAEEVREYTAPKSAAADVQPDHSELFAAPEQVFDEAPAQAPAQEAQAEVESPEDAAPIDESDDDFLKFGDDYDISDDVDDDEAHNGLKGFFKRKK